MKGDELRQMLRARGLTQRAVADALGVSQPAVGRMLSRQEVGRVNAKAIRYIVDNGPEDRMLTIPEVLRQWPSRKQLSWYSGISASTLYRIFATDEITPRMSMAIRQASIEREKQREQTASAALH